MSDIRSFFGKPKAPPPPKHSKNAVEDDDGDSDVVAPTRKRKSKPDLHTPNDSPNKRPRTPATKESSSKPLKVVKAPTRQSPRGKRAAPARKAEKKEIIDLESDVEIQEPPKKRGRPAGKKAGTKAVEAKAPPKPSPQKPLPKKKARPTVVESDDSDDLDVRPPTPPSPPKKKARTSTKKQDVPETQEAQEIFDSIPTVPLPTPDSQQTEPRKFNYQSHAAHTVPPPAAGTKDLPTGAENCLAGLTFVFTGVLETLGRDEGIELVKRHGGKVTGAPSSKTSYVILGSDAGPKKLETIRKTNLKTINEDGLFELIKKLPANGGDSKAAAKYEEQKHKEEQKVKEMAAEMERQERCAGGAGGAGGGTARKSAVAGSQGAGDETRLWTVKYAPSALSQICGNKGQVEKLQRWLRNWHKNQQSSFKKAGQDGSGIFRAAIMHGPPGIGKTTAAHLVANLEGYDILESNASDTRSKKLVETGLKGVLDNTSLLGYFAADKKAVDVQRKKLVLIMDEVDGMSAGDRGGVGALAQVCKKTSIPMILICNERRLPKMKPFDFVTYDVPFRRPTVNDIRGRIATICFREGLKLPSPVIDALIEGTHADIRQIINMISTAKLDQEAMNFDQGKAMSKSWEKHIVLKPWDIAHKILSPAMFGQVSNKSLNDKIELYFNDHEFSYLMVQENYLKTTPTIANRYNGRERVLKTLELADQAAESISDGDLIDRMIHGPQQHWSLMPTHAVFSTVRPASYVYGNLGGQASFTSWLGQNSKLNKLSRFVKEIQAHMRLRASGDRHEVRQQYIPTLWAKTARMLQNEGKDAVEDVINLMDSYFLTKEDYDAIVELGVGHMDMESVKIESSTKATFTRLYNSQSHPLPFMKSSNVVAAKRGPKEKPDLEEAIDESDDAEDVSADKDVKDGLADDDEDVDLSKDKYVKQPKKKKGGATAAKKTAAAESKAAGSSRNKKTAAKKVKAEDDDEKDDKDDDEEDVKPARGRGAKGKGNSAAASKGKAPAGKGRGRPKNG